MELMERYIYAVTQKLPQQQRAEIDKELRGLIQDMLEERSSGGAPGPGDVEAVLLELGDPKDLADKYRGYQHYLISPKSFYPYLTVLKIVGFAVFIGMTVVFMIEAFTENNGGVQHVFAYLGTLVESCFQAFAWVTLIFAIIDRQMLSGAAKAMGDKTWLPADLPPIPEPSKQIKPHEPIIGILFSVVFFILMISLFDRIAVHIVADGKPYVSIPIFQYDVFRSYLPALIILIALGILQNVLKLFFGKWSIKLAVSVLFCNLASFVLSVVVFMDPALWNPDFMGQLAQTGIMENGSKAFDFVQKLWENKRETLFALLAIIFMAETISSFYKAFKD